MQVYFRDLALVLLHVHRSILALDRVQLLFVYCVLTLSEVVVVRVLLTQLYFAGVSRFERIVHVRHVVCSFTLLLRTVHFALCVAVQLGL